MPINDFTETKLMRGHDMDRCRAHGGAGLSLVDELLAVSDKRARVLVSRRRIPTARNP